MEMWWCVGLSYGGCGCGCGSGVAVALAAFGVWRLAFGVAAVAAVALVMGIVSWAHLWNLDPRHRRGGLVVDDDNIWPSSARRRVVVARRSRNHGGADHAANDGSA